MFYSSKKNLHIIVHYYFWEKCVGYLFILPNIFLQTTNAKPNQYLLIFSKKRDLLKFPQDEYGLLLRTK